MSLPPQADSETFSSSRVHEVLFNHQAQTLIAIAATLAALFWWAANLAPSWIALPAKLVSLTFALCGAAAAGLSLNAQARRGTPESRRDTIMRCRKALPSVFGVALPLAATAILVIVACGILLALCRLPYVGAGLFAVGIPAMAVLIAATVLVLGVWWLIAAAATWSGLDAIAAHCAALALLRGCRRALLTRLAENLGRALTVAALLALALGLAFALLVSLVLGALGGFAGSGFLNLHAATPAALHGAVLGLDVVAAVLLAELSLLPTMAGVLTWNEFSPRLDRLAVQRDADAIRSALHLARLPVPLADPALDNETPPISEADQLTGLKPGLDKLPAVLGEVRAVPLSALFLGVLAALIAVGAGAWLMLSGGTPETLPEPAPAQSTAPVAQSAPLASTPLPTSSEPVLRLVTPPKPRPKPAQSEAQSDEASSADPAASPDTSAKEAPHTSDEAH
ncbi:hypothetical protein [Niveibacterium terrae]|uniref:hypothetical protein n=1 Tax=Niveibacterium terrae TaxID=3373598 RepID=UPI003A8DCA1E